ncbi:MAG: polyprenyl synthetase family protein [Firmicutes bacterium]|nr:polyprenyl synthetase family protein [Bacillota bacterium]
MDLEEVIASYAPALGKVEEVIRRVEQRAESPAKEILAYLNHRSGKRLRPLLVIMSCSLFGSIPPQAILVAGAAELIHTAALLHDDVVDEASVRRNGPTVNHLWGDKAAVLVGDYLLAEALHLLLDTDRQMIGIMAGVVADMCTGELDQLCSRFNPNQALAAYLKRVEQKTARFFSACCRAGALLGGASASEVEALAAYGLNIGMAFQLVDDLLDLQGEARLLGKATGQDLAAGVLTLPVLYLLDDPHWGSLVQDHLHEPNLLADWAKQSGAIERSWKAARRYALAALGYLDLLPGKNHRTLRAISQFILCRQM